MLVVADTSPLVVLANIGQTGVLPVLFREVVIPPQVKVELGLSHRPKTARDLATAPPVWLVEKTPKSIMAIPKLNAGEMAAISLALELSADVLLIDEAAGRRAAVQNGLKVTGTIGVLEAAADANLLDLAQEFAKIKQTDFWVKPAFLDEFLKKYRLKKGSSK